MPVTKPVNTTATSGYGGTQSSPFGPQPGGGFVIPIVKSLLNNNPNYESIFEIVMLSKNDLATIHCSNNQQNDLMVLSTIFIDVEIVENDLPPVAAINIDPTVLDIAIGLIVNKYIEI